MLSNGCKTFGYPAGYDIERIEYPEEWKDWDHHKKYVQLTGRARMTFNLNTPRHFLLSHPESYALTEREDFDVVLSLVRCSAAAGKGYIYGCKDSESSPWPVPDIDPQAEGISWDMAVTVRNLKTGNPLPTRMAPGCQLRKFCTVYITFQNADDRPDISMNLGKVSVNGKSSETPTIYFSWHAAYWGFAYFA